MRPDSDPFEFPINGELDLHTFRPSDLGSLLPDYLQACQQRGLLEVRVVHGKGTGQVARSVHAILRRLPEVARFSFATPAFGGEGATFVHLKPSPDSSPT
ncbi:MAG: Smr/MutS family protein [Verrucomicrobiota bacterium]